MEKDTDIPDQQEHATAEPFVAGVAMPGQTPGKKDSAVLAMDSLLTLLRLLKAEGLLALRTLPKLLAFDLYRMPAHFLTWLSFSVLVACAVHALTDTLLFAVGAFFLLQLCVTIFVELRVQHLRERMNFPESRKCFDLLQAGLRERFQHEDSA